MKSSRAGEAVAARDEGNGESRGRTRGRRAERGRRLERRGRSRETNEKACLEHGVRLSVSSLLKS